MIMIKVLMTTRDNQHGVARAISDFELLHDPTRLIPRANAERLTAELFTRAREAEGNARDVMRDRVFIEAAFTKGIGYEPAREVSISFPSRICREAQYPELMYRRVVREWICRLVDEVAPGNEKTPAQ